MKILLYFFYCGTILFNVLIGQEQKKQVLFTRELIAAATVSRGKTHRIASLSDFLAILNGRIEITSGDTIEVPVWRSLDTRKFQTNFKIEGNNFTKELSQDKQYMVYKMFVGNSTIVRSLYKYSPDTQEKFPFFMTRESYTIMVAAKTPYKSCIKS